MLNSFIDKTTAGTIIIKPEEFLESDQKKEDFYNCLVNSINDATRNMMRYINYQCEPDLRKVKIPILQ